MNKFLSILLVYFMLICPCIAADIPASLLQNSVNINVEKIPLKSKLLKKKYSAYSIQFKNVSSNPLKVNNISVSNIANDADKLHSSCHAISPLSSVLLILSPFTFGITSLIDIPVMAIDLNNVKKSTAEAVKYDARSLINAKNEVMMPSQDKIFNVAVPANETPKVTGVFEDVQTHEYITVRN